MLSHWKFDDNFSFSKRKVMWKNGYESSKDISVCFANCKTENRKIAPTGGADSFIHSFVSSRTIEARRKLCLNGKWKSFLSANFIVCELPDEPPNHKFLVSFKMTMHVIQYTQHGALIYIQFNYMPYNLLTWDSKARKCTNTHTHTHTPIVFQSYRAIELHVTVGV